MKSLIENAWNERSLLDNKMTQNAIKEVIKKLDNGDIRIAEKKMDSGKLMNG